MVGGFGDASSEHSLQFLHGVVYMRVGEKARWCCDLKQLIGGGVELCYEGYGTCFVSRWLDVNVPWWRLDVQFSSYPVLLDFSWCKIEACTFGSRLLPCVV